MHYIMDVIRRGVRLQYCSSGGLGPDKRGCAPGRDIDEGALCAGAVMLIRMRCAPGPCVVIKMCCAPGPGS